MCGICCCLFADNEISRSKFQVISDYILPHLERRGPDHTGRKDFPHKNDRETFYLSLTGTLLHLRGRKTPQPLIDDFGNILLWNGEIFGGIEVKENENDSLVLLQILSRPESDVTHTGHILSTLAKVQGPWSFVYWQATEQKLWFGRDYFGRRSLLWHLPSNPDDVLAITSVTERNSTAADKNARFEEIPADGLYCVDLVNDVHEGENEELLRIRKFAWKQSDEGLQHTSFLTCPVTPFNKQMPHEQDLLGIEENRRRFSSAKKGEMCGETEKSFANERKTLIAQESCVQRTKKESVVENDISSLKIAETKTVSENFESREVSFDTDVGRTLKEATLSLVNDTSAGNIELNSLNDQPYHRSNNLSKLNVDSENSQACCVEILSDTLTPNKAIGRTNTPEDGTQSSLNRDNWSLVFEEFRGRFIAVLGKAVKKRVFNLPRTNGSSILLGCQETLSDLTSGIVSTQQSFACSSLQLKDARVGILFSGGIDSIMIAALADKFVPPEEAIDLINVAFEQRSQPGNPHNKKERKGNVKQNATTSTKPAPRKFNVPDRITGLSGLEELQRLNPARRWNFIEVDVTLEELQEERSRHISHLVSPLNTVLDDSIGCALWFAARGRGRLLSSTMDGQAGNQQEKYTSKAKVLLVGMGADEQLGGYARHRTRFINEGWCGLMDEMEMEVKRISKRNLGRDDRCISDHGREARFPFLDEEVVSFLNSLPVWIKTDPGLPRGTGEKLLLRQAARLLGLTSSSELPKRAIQFGSRIAKLESCGEKGSEACARLEF